MLLEQRPKARSQEEYHVIKDDTQLGLGPSKEVTQMFLSVREGEAGSDDAESSKQFLHLVYTGCSK